MRADRRSREEPQVEHRTARLPKAVIVTRTSTDRQDTSNKDQEQICRRFCADKYEVADVFHDVNRSSRTLADRDGLDSALKGIKDGRYDILVAESFDRLSRTPAGLQSIYDRLLFSGKKAETVNHGELTQMFASLFGIMGQIVLGAVSDNTRRALDVRHQEGRPTGGTPPFGYKIENGYLAIDDERATWVVKIFEWYAQDGMSPSAIARRLNREGVKSSTGGYWTRAMIKASGRRIGVLCHELYDGHRTWGRVRTMRDPETGKRRLVHQPVENQECRPFPALRIVPHDLFCAAERRARENREKSGQQRHGPLRLLSGKVRCAGCGSSMLSQGRRGGQTYLQCSLYRDARACTSKGMVNRSLVEQSVVSQIQRLLRDTSALNALADQHNKELSKEIKKRESAITRLNGELKDLNKKIDRLIDAIESGEEGGFRIRSRIEQYEKRAHDVEAKIAEIEQNSPASVMVDYDAVSRAITIVDALGEHLRTTAEVDPDSESVHAFRNLISRVEVRSNGRGKAPSIEIFGKIKKLWANAGHSCG